MLRRRLVFLLALLLAVLGVSIYLRQTAPEPSASQSDLPAGRWRLAAPKSKPSNSSGEDLARTISLPYLSGSKAPPAGSGVTIWDRRRAFPGVNLYASGHAPEVYLIDMAGRTLRRWRYPFERAFPGKAPTEETAFFRRAQLAPSGPPGTLLAIYQGGGLVALDRTSRLLWKVDAGTYNDFFRGPDGTIYLLTKVAKIIPEVSASRPALEDSITIVDSQGRICERISLLRALLDSPFAPLFSPHATAGDILHANTIEIFDGRLATRSALFAQGNALVSLREIDTIGIVDLKTRRFVWAERGPWAGQHQPTLLDSGKILLFDNQPHRRLSFVEEIDPLSGQIGWRYPPPGKFLSSEQAGAAQRLPNGNTLITESDRGRALEVTPAGETVWEFLSPHRAGPKDAFVATLFEMVRLSEDPAGR